MTTKIQEGNHFSELGIAENFLAVLDQKGFNTPTPIQHQILPAALDGKDVVGIAQTGTGKTLAFGIPMIQRLALHKGQGLILVPTRELALQIEQALSQIGAPLRLYCAVVIGGVSQQSQVSALRRNPHIVIATPGRLDDLMQQGLYKLDRIKIITLDEADRMLDVGFLPQIKKILHAAPKPRQTMLFSATMPQSISRLATEFMKMPLRIEIAPQGTAAQNVEQEIFVVTKNSKMRLLDSLLQTYQKGSVLLFSRTKFGAKRIARDIRHMNHTATEIHSNRSQAQRKAALDGFKDGKFRIMVATDIAARGIDVKDIALVINFDLPDNSDDYVHRIGRTGRAGSYGKAISFVTPSEKADIKKIERLIRKSLPVLSLPTLPPARKTPAYEKKFTPYRSNKPYRSKHGSQQLHTNSYQNVLRGSLTPYGSKPNRSRRSRNKNRASQGQQTYSRHRR